MLPCHARTLLLNPEHSLRFTLATSLLPNALPAGLAAI